MTYPTAVRELAAGIADDIRTYGHYQGRSDQYLYGSSGGMTGQCCVQENPHVLAAFTTVWPELRQLLPLDGVYNSILPWNDNTPTEEVLAELDRIATS